MAASTGAKTVSLTGVIAMATDYCRDVEQWIEGMDLPVITTGDATRAATIVKSVEGILAETEREISDEILSIVGLGSIGFGTLRLMLEVLPHPKQIILCDPYQTDDQMARHRDEIRAFGYDGKVDIVKNGGALPPEVYQASLVVASSNLPGVLNIDLLKPGALVVDYSFPPVFKVDAAVARFTSRHDILFTTGGELKMPTIVNETVYLPEDAAALAEGMEGGFIQFLGKRDKNEITGCILVSLLTGLNKKVNPTIGPVSGEDALAHYRHLEALGVAPARLQMNGFFLPEDIVGRFNKESSKS
jgi:predicted amino acid dehydrogenase